MVAVRRVRARPLLAVLLAWLLLLTGCGTNDGLGAVTGATVGDALAGRSFLSTGVTRDGAPHELVDGSRVRMSFDDGRVSVQAGCNTLFGGYRVEDGVLRVDAMGGTEMGCPEDLMAQDAWLVETLESGPELVLEGDDLTLTTEASTLTLLDRKVADPDRPLVGTVWRVDSFLDGDAVSSVPGRAVATLTLLDDGTLEMRSSCNQARAAYQLTEDEQVLVLSDVEMTTESCDDERDDLEGAVMELLRADELAVDIEADTLTLTEGDKGLILREL